MKKIVFCIVGMFFCFFAHAQQQEIVNCFKSGSSDCLAEYFNENIDLTVGNVEGVFSKSQSKVILQKFFNENSVQNFTILHQNGSDSAKNIIAQLQTQNKSYRIYLLVKTINTNPIIQKIRIEND
ncbi:MAG: DUF4783 domain-containing protein [Bacteroidales bacterium]|jgi:glycosylphosphatidylinositol transamidase (GPIT) subunit GPI8|nr:DUF4783 domain-containing protein [Bacteroidales bacterium]